MDIEVFRQEIITTLELDIAELKSNTTLDIADLEQLSASLDHCVKTTKVMIDCLK